MAFIEAVHWEIIRVVLEALGIYMIAGFTVMMLAIYVSVYRNPAGRGIIGPLTAGVLGGVIAVLIYLGGGHADDPHGNATVLPDHSRCSGSGWLVRRAPGSS